MVATRFAVAIHILMLLATNQAAGEGSAPATSLCLARSVNTNPVVVRRITRQLARAGLIWVRRGPGGAALLRPPEAISLCDVWRAVNPGCGRPLLPVHARPDPGCPVGARIGLVLGQAFGAAETALQDALGRTTLASLLGQLAEAA
jgi:DNA-binding IscR family transcriptional regulator